MAESRAKIEDEKRAKEEATEKVKREAAMVADMLKEMYRLNPEFAARREAVLQVRIVHAFSGSGDSPSRSIPSSARQHERSQTYTAVPSDQFPVVLKPNTVFRSRMDVIPNSLSIYLIGLMYNHSAPSPL